jgi:glucan phosphoethanolaminetransferase (alkaline phosphatase superfamily)
MGSKTGARYIGYGLVLLGVLLLLFVFYIGYLLYLEVISGSLSSSLSSYNSNMAGAAVGTSASLLQSLGVNGFLMLLIAIFVLLILASIAGRIVKYGMDMLSLASEELKEEENEEKKQAKEKENKTEEKRKK